MSGPLSKSLGLSSALNIAEEGFVTKRQGIGSILGSDTDQRPTKGVSLRRTLSADMSSKKWLTQHGFYHLKKIASSEEFPVSIVDSSSEEAEEDYEEMKGTEARTELDIWTSIQQERKKKELEKPDQFDIWSLIRSQKAEEESSKSPLPPPYIHPLVKRSASSLSEKSLEICTESLGSETGSDDFSSSPPPETNDMEEAHGLQQQKQEKVAQLTYFDAEDDQPRIVKYYNYDVGGKKSPQYDSFPPPIPSLSRKDGASLRMETHRDNGRLVLAAVSAPSHNNFLAQRHDGRLVLTFANPTPSGEAEPEAINGVMEFESFGDEEKESEIDMIIDDEEEEEEEEESEMEQAPTLSCGAMNVHRLAVIMKKPIWLANRNPTWPKNFEEIIKFGEGKEKAEPTNPSPPSQSLPPHPRVARLIPSPPPPPPPPPPSAAAVSFNAYEYFWRRPNQPMSKAAIKEKINRSKVECFVPCCKEPRRSLLFWDPHCIATS